MNIWPNFFIVGAPKAATTSFYYYLNKIPKIFMSPIKEPNYFSVTVMPDNHMAKPIRDKEKYLQLFKKVKKEKIIGEASPLYLSDPNAPKLIYEIAPQAKILICIRDPLERIFSAYLMGVRLGYTKLTFHEEVEHELRNEIDETKPQIRLKAGLYSEDVQRYLDIFGKEQIKIIIFEEFVKTPKETVKEILRFLDLEYSLDDFKGESHNPFAVTRGPISQYILRSETVNKIAGKIIPSNLRKLTRKSFLEKKQPKPEMLQVDKDTLIEFYKDDVKKLQIILGRKLPWKNF